MLKLIMTSSLIIGLMISNIFAKGLEKRTGKVLEVIESGGYTYLNFQENKETYWVAVPQVKVKKGQTITIKEQVWMNNFQSKTLNKTFDKILFAIYKDNPYSNNDAQNMDFPSLATALKTHQPTKASNKATNKVAIQTSIAKIKKDKQSFSNKKIVLEGKVVKVLRNIMNTSWVHIQDANNDKIIFRAAFENVKKGDKIKAEGTVNTDVDYGYGYTYEIIVVDSLFKKI